MAQRFFAKGGKCHSVDGSDSEAQSLIDAGYVEMDGPRPDNHYVAHDNGDGTGTWVADLDGVLAEAEQIIDQAADRARERHAAKARHSVGATYREKYKQARAYADAGYPSGSIADYPYIQAESDRKGVSYQTVADNIIAKHDAWQADSTKINPQIEAERTGGKNDCRAAHSNGDLAGIETARDNAVAALDAI